MKNYDTNIIPLFLFKDKKLKATFYTPNQSKIKATILYFHGGGDHADDLQQDLANRSAGDMSVHSFHLNTEAD